MGRYLAVNYVVRYFLLAKLSDIHPCQMTCDAEEKRQEVRSSRIFSGNPTRLGEAPFVVSRILRSCTFSNAGLF